MTSAFRPRSAGAFHGTSLCLSFIGHFIGLAERFDKVLDKVANKVLREIPSCAFPSAKLPYPKPGLTTIAPGKSLCALTTSKKSEAVAVNPQKPIPSPANSGLQRHFSTAIVRARTGNQPVTRAIGH